MANLEIISLVLFFTLMVLLLYKNKKTISYKNGVSIIRWKRGKELLDVIANRTRKILPAVGLLSVITGILATSLGVAYIIQFSLKFQQAFAIALPSVSGISYPGPIIGVPFWYWIIGVFIIIFAHESMHGIFARLDNVKIKSYGIITFLVLPIGAFVDPDEKQLKKLATWKKLRILSAGSFINIFLSIVFLILAVGLGSGLYEDNGVTFSETTTDLPAYNAGLNGTITSIDGKQVNTIQDLSRILNATESGSEIEVTTTEGEYRLTTVARPDGQPGSFIGINNAATNVEVKDSISPYKSPLTWIYGLIVWLHILNLGVGIANMLPIKPLDGGLFYEEILVKYFGEKGHGIVKIVSILILMIFLFNIFGIPILKYLMR